MWQATPRTTPTTRGAAGRKGVLLRLRSDVSGNTLAMAAAAMIPLAGMIGSGLDMSRTYLVKARLQSACDAGALAARKMMDSSGTLNTEAAQAGQNYFTNNFPATTYGVSNLSFTPTLANANEVTATATATVPMSLMKIFGYDQLPLTATCNARYDTADTDVMFVLDTTNSMACTPTEPDNCGQVTTPYVRPDGTNSYYGQEHNGSRISALRNAVMTFYDTVAGSVDPSTHVRYGFVPYTSTVNAGYAITSVSPSYMVSSWNYQTRQVVGDANSGGPTQVTQTPVSQATCNGMNNTRTPATGFTTNGTASLLTTSWSGSSGGSCVKTTQQLIPIWRYRQWPLNVSQFVAGQTVVDPTKITGATSKWQGCVEERDTTVSSTFDSANLPPDLDPDLVPSNDSTRWRPMWPDVIYARTNATSVDSAGTSSNPYGDGASDGTSYLYGSSPTLSTANTAFSKLNNGWYLQSGFMTCGKAVQRLTTMTRSDVANYVNAPDFVPWGGTYHDTGMIWGTRLISPTGIFGADTAPWPNRNPPNRYIVFMTDGQMATNQNIYGMYGWENYDQRTSGGAFANQDAWHNARFLAECQAAKNRNITVFVVTVKTAPDANLNACSSSGTAYFATNAATLTTAFQTIAKQVAMLRLSK